MAQQKKPQVRVAILDAAFKLFAIKGYAATSIGEIGRRREPLPRRCIGNPPAFNQAVKAFLMLRS